MKFEKLSAPTLKDMFVQQLQDKILSGEIPIGTILPPERELAAQMQVSRAVINNGLSELEKQGFLEVKPRIGSTVSDYRKTGNINTLIAIMEYQGGCLGTDEIRSILELRVALERMAIRHAVEHATDKDLHELEKTIHKLAQSQTPTEAASFAFEFQHELAFIGGNSILPLIYYSFKLPVINLWTRYCTLYGIEVLCRNTEILYKHICNRDIAGANKWSKEYLDAVINGNQRIYYDM